MTSRGESPDAASPTTPSPQLDTASAAAELRRTLESQGATADQLRLEVTELRLALTPEPRAVADDPVADEVPARPHPSTEGEPAPAVPEPPASPLNKPSTVAIPPQLVRASEPRIPPGPRHPRSASPLDAMHRTRGSWMALVITRLLVGAAAVAVVGLAALAIGPVRRALATHSHDAPSGSPVSSSPAPLINSPPGVRAAAVAVTLGLDGHEVWVHQTLALNSPVSSIEIGPADLRHLAASLPGLALTIENVSVSIEGMPAVLTRTPTGWRASTSQAGTHVDLSFRQHGGLMTLSPAVKGRALVVIAALLIDSGVVKPYPLLMTVSDPRIVDLSCESSGANVLCAQREGPLWTAQVPSSDEPVAIAQVDLLR